MPVFSLMMRQAGTSGTVKRMSIKTVDELLERKGNVGCDREVIKSNIQVLCDYWQQHSRKNTCLE